MQPLLPKLAALQRDGAVSTEKVQIVERAMHHLSRPGLNPDDVLTAEQLLTEHAPILRPTDLRRFALQVVAAADPDGREPVDDQLQQDRRHLELKQRRDGMWHLQGKLTNTLGAQLNAILDPLAEPRTSTIELLAKAGLAETSDGSQLTPISCSGLPMRPRSGPPSSTATAFPSP